MSESSKEEVAAKILAAYGGADPRTLTARERLSLLMNTPFLRNFATNMVEKMSSSGGAKFF